MAVKTHKRLQIALEEAQKALQLVKEKESGINAKKESLEGNIDALKLELNQEREKLVMDMSNQGFATYKEYTAAKRTEDVLNLWKNKYSYTNKIGKVL